MEFKEIYKIEIANQSESGFDCRADLDGENIWPVANIIADQMKKYQPFRDAIFDCIVDRFGPVILTKANVEKQNELEN